MIFQAEWLLNGEGASGAEEWLREGWLRIEGDLIAETGSGEPPAGFPVTRLEGCMLLPGLVNAHSHLELTALEDALTPGKIFPEWVKDLQGAAADFKLPDYRTAAEQGIERLLAGGCTTVLDVGNTGEALKALAAGPLRAFACVEALGLDPVHARSRFDNAVSIARSEARTDRFEPGVAPHAPYSCSVELLRSLVDHQVAHRLPVTIHAAESREEAELFASSTGPMQEFCKRIHPAAPEHRDTTPVRWLESEGLLPQGALIIHGNTLDDADMEILARRGAVVVHCPSSHAFFGHPRFPYERLRAHGIPVCLGTDSLASADSLSMLVQMRLFSRNYPEVPPEEILRMATVVGAEALGIGDRVGKLKAGYKADLIGVSCEGYSSPREALMSKERPAPEVRAVLIDGRLVGRK